MTASTERMQWGQSGQALVESMVTVIALVMLWVALHWLSNYQDMTLSAAHASRHAAFMATRLDSGAVPNAEHAHEVTAAFFAGDAHRWKDRHGNALLNPEAGVRPEWRSERQLSTRSEPGGRHSYAAQLRREWSLGDADVMRARVKVDPAVGRLAVQASNGPLRLSAFDAFYPAFHRETSILTGAGHSASDLAAQAKTGASRLAWADAETASHIALTLVRNRARGVDEGWNRELPALDWLRPWLGRVPGHLIEDY